MDILTPKGQTTIADAEAAIQIFLEAHPGFDFVPTPQHKPAVVDGMVTLKGGDIKAVVEMKCRYGITLEAFRLKFGNEWILTMSKLIQAAAVSNTLRVPLYGFVYLVDDKALMVKPLTDSLGQICVPFRCEKTTTRKTINGGEANRANAYISMDGCQVLCSH